MWQAWMRREYGIHPWELVRYTPAELHALREDMLQREQQSQEVMYGS